MWEKLYTTSKDGNTSTMKKMNVDVSNIDIKIARQTEVVDGNVCLKQEIK